MASKVHDMLTTNRISLMSSMFNDMSCTFEASFMVISNPGLDDLVSIYFDCSNVAHDYSENLNSLCATDIKKMVATLSLPLMDNRNANQT
jgi:hypothetical protein